jgi:hypothetical protein
VKWLPPLVLRISVLLFQEPLSRPKTGCALQGPNKIMLSGEYILQLGLEALKRDANLKFTSHKTVTRTLTII